MMQVMKSANLLVTKPKQHNRIVSINVVANQLQCGIYKQYQLETLETQSH